MTDWTPMPEDHKDRVALGLRTFRVKTQCVGEGVITGETRGRFVYHEGREAFSVVVKEKNEERIVTQDTFRNAKFLGYEREST